MVGCRARRVVASMVCAFAVASCASSPRSGDGSDAALEKFLESYFATWSAGDMKAYGEHFHEYAVVTVLRDGRAAPWTARDRFVDGQRVIRERSAERIVERMTSYVADIDAHAATVVAQWELTRGAGVDAHVTRGVDRFTLVKNEAGEWRIVALVFYSTE